MGEEIRVVVADWVTYPRMEKLWGLDDPLFPATRVAAGADRRFVAVGLDRKHWSGASRSGRYSWRRLRRLDFRISTPIVSGRLGASWGPTLQNTGGVQGVVAEFGHDHVLTTFSSYGDVGSYRQAEIIRAFSERGEPPRQVT